MKVKTVIMVCISICLCFSFSSYAGGKYGHKYGHEYGHEYGDKYGHKYGDKYGGKILVLNLVGSGEMYPKKVPAIDGAEDEADAICFDVDLVNAKNGQVIGTATDCLSEINDDNVNGGLALVGTSYFYMHQGMLVTRGKTTVQPTNHEIITPSGQMITHITGAAGIDNAIIDGTGRFAGRTGTVRLSGMVDMTNFFGEEGDPIAFDCLFVIILD
ncbi:MAG: hypothetical protein HRU20_22820 [Pseudomonadales bacterium]|nr:hypothetical protein [Pseudomonadales bacterium]